MQAQVTGPPRRKLAPITTRTFGHFRLERRVAYGGMAEILLAVDVRNGRQIALKRILPHYSQNPDFVQFFVHEGRLGQRLNHPNLVTTYEAGRVGETCYIALEYLRGATCIEVLRAAARRGVELPLGAAVRIVADAARGLHYAHTACDATGKPLGVVHRDVTPHNLFLCRDGGIKVLDFGIAKAASQLHVTRTGTIKGKFAYLAPEQIRGESIDARVDVFALGIVLHELLTLRPLFRGLNDADTLHRILTVEVPPPERLRHAVPPGLGAVALRALQRDRERRLPSAQALADSIEAVAEAECIDASPEVVLSLLGELCPPDPLEEQAPEEQDFDLEPPSVRSSSGRLADALSGPLLIALPPKVKAALAIADTRHHRASPPPIPVEVEEPIPIEELAIEEPVALGHGTGSAPVTSERRRGSLLAAVLVSVALLLVVVLLLAQRTNAPPPPPLPPPTTVAAPLVAPPAVVARPPRTTVPEEATLRVLTDGPATLYVDGKVERPAGDGALRLAPGRHRVVVGGPSLALAHSFDVQLESGEAATRVVHSGRGRLRLAVTPWAEVQLDGRAAGTTPLQPLELPEGAHWLQLKNGQLNALVKRRVVVFPDKETAVRVDLFSDRR
jgi:serine/threonine protein kinase